MPLRPDGLREEESLKVLLTNDFGLSAKEVVEFYELRWQIELFFRELKSELGLGDYRGTDFRAFERHVDLVLLAFLCLEWLRSTDVIPKRSLDVRTQTLLVWLQADVMREDLQRLEKEILQGTGRRRLASILRKLTSAPAPKVDAA